MDRGERRTWPPEEQTAVEAYLLSFWQCHLVSDPARHDTDTIVASIAVAVHDMSPYLDVWSSLQGLAPTIHYAEFLHDNATSGGLDKRLSNPWLRHRPPQEGTVRAWLVASAESFVPRLDSAFLEVSGEETLYILASAIDVANDVSSYLDATASDRGAPLAVPPPTHLR